jgi:hypothetical protein
MQPSLLENLLQSSVTYLLALHNKQFDPFCSLFNPTMKFSPTSNNVLMSTIASLCLALLTVIFFFKNMMEHLDVGSGDHVDKLETYNLKHRNSKEEQCLSLDLESDMDELLSKFKQVFVIMPAKNAGSSFEAFTKSCMKEKGSWQTVPNPIHRKSKRLKNMLQSSFEMPTLIASHIFDSEYFIDLVKHATDDSLIIYVHRTGTDRLRSAIAQVSAYPHCTDKYVHDQCTLKEGEVLDFIAAREREIGHSENRILRCEAYESIEANAPNMVFMNYMQSNKMFQLLAKHHCPGQKAVHTNSGKRSKTIWVELENSTHNGNSTVELKDWLDAKMEMLEVTLKLKHDVSCQATTRKMQHDLLSCQDETMHVSSSDGSLLGFF